MESLERRHDIDWLRVIAIGLLLVYHTAIAFQSWGFLIGFMTNSEALDALWIPMSMLNIWRIPLLFFISGMGMYFMLQRKSYKAVAIDRVKRLLVPLIFGTLVVVPLQIMLIQRFYGQPISYVPNPAHLWFLGNIFVYFLIVLFVMRFTRNLKLQLTVQRLFAHPTGLLVVIFLFVLEAWLVAPVTYELYAMTWHGFILGLLAFLSGYCFGSGEKSFTAMIKKWRFALLGLAVLLFLYRLEQGQGATNVLKALESNLWTFAIFAFALAYLNRGGSVLKYLSEAAYPVYILHMLVLNLFSLWVLPLQLNPAIKYVLLLILTFIGCFATYALLVKRFKITRVLFGLK